MTAVIIIVYVYAMQIIIFNLTLYFTDTSNFDWYILWMVNYTSFSVNLKCNAK